MAVRDSQGLVSPGWGQVVSPIGDGWGHPFGDSRELVSPLRDSREGVVVSPSLDGQGGWYHLPGYSWGLASPVLTVTPTRDGQRRWCHPARMGGGAGVTTLGPTA